MYHLYLEMFEPEQYEHIQQGLPFSGKVKEHFYRYENNGTIVNHGAEIGCSDLYDDWGI